MTTLEAWMKALAGELGVEIDADVNELLDLARRAAHGVDRPAAPLTTFLVGYAAGRSASATAVADAVRTAGAAIDQWEPQPLTDNP